MTSVRSMAAALVAKATDPVEGAPPAALTLRPSTPDEVAEILTVCSASGHKVLIWGGGTHQGLGGRVEPDIVLSTERLDRVVDHQPDDLTLVVEGGVTLAAIDNLLAEHGQMAILPQGPPTATIGGVLSAGISGFHRSRFGPSRDYLLEVSLATGDGRLVRAGGRVVKNVQGYDLMRLAAGSFGALGVVTQVCLKLWPNPSARAAITVEDPGMGSAAFRPWAVLERRGVTEVFVAGTPEEIASQGAVLGGEFTEGHRWPAPPDGESTWSLRVPPASVSDAVERLPATAEYVAQHGVGTVEFGAPTDGWDVVSLRSWAEAAGGALVMTGGPAELRERVDPWGTPPSTMALQRRIVARFDPDRILNPGRLPGGL